MSSSDFSYKFLNRELNNQRLREPVGVDLDPSVDDVVVAPSSSIPSILRPRVQGPYQRQTRQVELNEGSQPFTTRRDWFRSQILPQVFERIGSSSIDEIYDTIRQRESEESNSLYSQDNSPTGAIEPRETRFNSFPDWVEDSSGRTVGRQYPIPGLASEIEKSNSKIRTLIADLGLKEFLNVIDKYPELVPLLEDSKRNEGVVATRISGADFKPYQQYADTEQVYSDPEARAFLYDTLLNRDPEVDAHLLRQAEKLYVSGDPEKQALGRSLLIEDGVPVSDLQAIESSAFQQKRPVIGGGGYVDIETSPEVRYINERARALNSALNKLDYPTYEAVKEKFPGLSDRVPSVETERTYYSPTEYDTGLYGGEWEDFDPDESGYRVDVSRGGNSNKLLSFDQGDFSGSEISRNVLRFLKDNPAFAPASVSFRTAGPMENLSYDAKDLPEELKLPIMRFVNEASMISRPGGTILENSPVKNYDLIDKARIEGKTPKTSSYLRMNEPFEEKNVSAPSIRGQAYTLSGYGPTSIGNEQFTFIDRRGNAIPLQPFPPERPLVGRISIGDNYADATPAASYKSQPRYYSTLVPGVTPETINRIAGDIKRTPSSLLPGVADLIPSAEAVRRGYQEGPQAMGEQMAKDFVAGLPVAAAAAPILSSAPLAPLAPGIGAGLVGNAAVEAVNEVVRQQTGEGIVPKIRQAIGTRPRTGVSSAGYRAPTAEYRPQQITKATPQAVANLKKQQTQNEIQRRLRLVGERFNPGKGEFGLTEILFGR